ncbi:hypothetical protein ACSUZJ_00395 [Telluria sp. B2]
MSLFLEVKKTAMSTIPPCAIQARRFARHGTASSDVSRLPSYKGAIVCYTNSNIK